MEIVINNVSAWEFGMIDLIYFLANSFLLPILIALITFFITKHFDKKKEIPRILLVHTEHGINIAENNYDTKTVKLKGYYKKQRELDEQLKKFLIYNGYTDTILTTKILENIVKEYRGNLEYNNANSIRKDEIVKLIKYFEYNNEFIRRLKVYEAYMDNSKWGLKITNVGKSDAYDLKIEQFPESYFPFKSYNANLKVNDSIYIDLIYFDDTLRINEYSRDIYQKYECGFTNNQITKFYLVKSNKYNRKDERIFRLSFKDCYTKEHEYYCCAKIVKSSDIIQNLRIKLDKESNLF